MRILVFSDTHKNISGCIKTIENIIGVDMIIHAGDHASDACELQKIFPDIPIKFVKGNCDFSNSPAELIIDITADKKIFVTHGHLYNAKTESDYYSLKNRGLELGCEMVVFGHTHVPYNENFGEITLLNPGSAKYSQTFGVIEVENGKIKSAVCSLNTNF